MKKYVHVNQHIIKRNRKTGEREPVISVKTYKSNNYSHEVYIDGPCWVRYTPDNPLSCGATVYILTEAEVQMTRYFSSYEDIPESFADVILSHANVKKITDVSIEDINGFIAGMSAMDTRPTLKQKEK